MTAVAALVATLVAIASAAVPPCTSNVGNIGDTSTCAPSNSGEPDCSNVFPAFASTVEFVGTSSGQVVGYFETADGGTTGFGSYEGSFIFGNDMVASYSGSSGKASDVDDQVIVFPTCNACFCGSTTFESTCPAAPTNNDPSCKGGYLIKLVDNSFVCFKFGNDLLPTVAPGVTGTIPTAQLDVALSTVSRTDTFTYTHGFYQLNAAGHLLAVSLSAPSSNDAVIFFACGPLAGVTGARKRDIGIIPNAISISPGGPQALNGGASGDPHFAGANGVKFDFNGEPNGDYVLFSAPQLQVNMHLAGDGPAVRFMTQVGVVFRNVTMQFGIYRLNQAFFDHLNAQLAPFGAKASYNGWQIRLQLCPGEEIVLTQMHSNTKLYPELVHDDGSIFYYLNVEIRTPHCNDAYGGALGQTYKCAYVEDREEFKFDHASEESFRVKSLQSVDESSFSADAACGVPPAGAARSMIGGMSH